MEPLPPVPQVLGWLMGRTQPQKGILPVSLPGPQPERDDAQAQQCSLGGTAEASQGLHVS